MFKSFRSKYRNYAFYIKVELNYQYIKTKQSCKFKAKFFSLFKIFHLVRNQVYKLELPKNRKLITFFTYHYFYIILQGISRQIEELLSQNLKLVIIKRTRLREFEIVQSILECQKITYQDFTIRFFEKVTLKKKIPRSLVWLYNILKS